MDAIVALERKLIEKDARIDLLNREYIAVCHELGKALSDLDEVLVEDGLAAQSRKTGEKK